MLATLTFDHIGCADWKSLRQTIQFKAWLHDTFSWQLELNSERRQSIEVQ
jgi:hypothetical protein